MTHIHMTTFIAAPVERAFDLSRNLTVWKYVFNNRKEIFSSGAGSKLIDKDETLTLMVKHAGKMRSSMLKITQLQKPVFFAEEQVKGDLENFRHEHHFKKVDNGCILIDLVYFGPPTDLLGRFLGKRYLRKYLEGLIRKRNEIIRHYAETESWRAVLT
ncbi:MAG TPA: cell division protein [Flavitalea sp.]|nr:cell division protein [Flavitalea sp.]